MARKQTFTFTPVLMDRTVDLEPGAEVQKIQPHGAPRNGAFGQCYVQRLDGTFVGMVCLGSLVETGRKAEFRDLAREARDAKDAAREAARAARRQARRDRMFVAL